MILSAIDALIQIHSEQGYLVFHSPKEYRVGQIIIGGGMIYINPQGNGTQLEWCNQPMRVVGFASAEDSDRQQTRLDELTNTDSSNWIKPDNYFYKVVAAD
jgi:hypothetical protein